MGGATRSSRRHLGYSANRMDALMLALAQADDPSRVWSPLATVSHQLFLADGDGHPGARSGVMGRTRTVGTRGAGLASLTSSREVADEFGKARV